MQSLICFLHHTDLKYHRCPMNHDFSILRTYLHKMLNLKKKLKKINTLPLTLTLHVSRRTQSRIFFTSYTSQVSYIPHHLPLNPQDLLAQGVDSEKDQHADAACEKKEPLPLTAYRPDHLITKMTCFLLDTVHTQDFPAQRLEQVQSAGAGTAQQDAINLISSYIASGYALRFDFDTKKINPDDFPAQHVEHDQAQHVVPAMEQKDAVSFTSS